MPIMPQPSKRTLTVVVIAGVLAAQILALAQAGQFQRTASQADVNTPAVPPVGLLGYLASPRGRFLLRSAAHPMLRALAQRLGVPSRDQQPIADASFQLVAPAPSATVAPTAVVSGCGVPAGTRFNLEPRAAPAVAPQNGPSVDFLPGAGLMGADLVVGSANDTRGLFGGLGDSNTGYYVHRNGAHPNPCSADFDGGLPSFTSRATGDLIFGGGDSALEADAARAAVFIVDSRFSFGASTLGLFRNTAANLTNPAMCPDGTHDGAAAAKCWPVHTEVNPRADGTLNVFPQLAVDARVAGSGLGAGDVYVSNTFSTLAGVFIVLTACDNSLTRCSSTNTVSGGDLRTLTSDVRVRPDGGVTVTYVNVEEGPAPDFLQLYDIKYITCTPRGAPNAPLCSPPKLIVREDQPVPSRGGGLGGGNLAAANFQITTSPKHDHRTDTNGTETYVVWDRCKVPNIHGGDKCPDADIRMAASKNNGASWTFGTVDTGSGDQYFPAIHTDSGSIVNIAYMSAQGDGGLNHRSRVLLRQIGLGGLTPDPVGAAAVITTQPMDPSADFFFGDAFIGSYIGVAARITPSGRHTYVHYTHTAVNGIYNGQPAPEQNNHLSRFDY
jgi:hypothetical protein